MLLGVARLLQWCCYVFLGVTRWLLGVAMALLGGCFGVAFWLLGVAVVFAMVLLWCCYVFTMVLLGVGRW